MHKICTPLAILVMTLLAAGCSVYSANDAPEAPLAVPERFVHAGAAPDDGESTVTPTPDRWWEVFGDAELNGLVDRALVQNLDLRRAWARLAQARAIASGADSGYWPTITAELGASAQRNVIDLGDPIGIRKNDTQTWTATVGAAYELDLWGKVAGIDKASELDVATTHENLQALAMTLSGQITEIWSQIVGDRAQLALIDAQAAASERYTELVELRFGQGLASALEVYQQRQQVQQVLAQRPLVEAQVVLRGHQLAVLLGQTPGTLALNERAVIPALPAPPAPGLPADMLARRPDVRAAQLQVAAADHRVGAAIADRFPTLRLGASTGFRAADLAEFFSSWVYNLAGSILGTLFDGGRKSAEVDRAKAQVEDLLHGYSQVILRAVVEVEDALVREQKQRAYLERLDETLALARQTLDEAQTRYVNGLSTYLNVLAALRSVQAAEQAQLSARRQLLSNRIQLYRALGGRWTEALTPTRQPAGK